ncbi:MAG: tRNA uridine-5-carboxymethylaminomethyl(34) synthesis GTPase MnmE, partial [Pseudomonadota bacterium]
SKLTSHSKFIFSNKDKSIITRQRHRILLQKILISLKEIDINSNIEIAAEDMRIILENFSEIIGNISNEEILGEIFSSFCIGK